MYSYNKTGKQTKIEKEMPMTLERLNQEDHTPDKVQASVGNLITISFAYALASKRIDLST